MAWFNKKDDVAKELEAYQKQQQNLENSAQVPTYGTAPASPVVGSGIFVVEDVFSITGRGTVVTGRVHTGAFCVGDAVRVLCHNGATMDTVVRGLELFRKMVEQVGPGDDAGMLLQGVERTTITRGDTVYRL